MAFPIQRARRLRRSAAIRGMVRETRLTTSGFIYPMFACPGSGVRTEVSSMPGVCQQSPDKLVEECREVEGLGIPGIMLFGLPEHKDERAALRLGLRPARCSARSRRFGTRSSISWWSPTFACANTPATDIAA